MNSVSRKSLDWHPYKSGGLPCSLACLIVICSLLDVTHKEHKWRNSFFRLSWKATSSCTEDVKYADNVQQYFRWENYKGLTIHYELEWSALFLFLIMTLTGNVVSGMKWRWLRELLPLLQAFITSSSLCKWRIWFRGPPQGGRWFLTLASPRYEASASI
jgi:hypothetical protein